MSELNRLQAMAEKMDSDLVDNIMPFWLQAADNENGGFKGAMTTDGVSVLDSPKGLVLNARILWSFSAAYRIYGQDEYLRGAERAFAYLTRYFWDPVAGGGFWQLNSDGTVKDEFKITYAQGFMLYAFSEYYRAAGKQEALDWADKVYEFIEGNCRRGDYYAEAVKGKEDAPGVYGMGHQDIKSMNTHLHIIEPVTNYYRIRNDKKTEETLVNLIRVVTGYIYNEETKHCDLFFDKEMKPTSTNVSYGHDIESSWLITEAAETLLQYTEDQKTAESLLKKCREIAVDMAEAVFHEGMDPVNGAVYNAGDKYGMIIDPAKVWWAQAEGIVGFVNAWQISKNGKYLSAAEKIWEYVEKHILNPKGKGWLATGTDSVADENTPYLINAWKCPYHNSRAAMEIHRRVRDLTNET